MYAIKEDANVRQYECENRNYKRGQCRVSHMAINSVAAMMHDPTGIYGGVQYPLDGRESPVVRRAQDTRPYLQGAGEAFPLLPTARRFCWEPL